MSRPQQFSNPSPTPKKPKGPKKVKDDPKLSQKKSRVEGNIKNEICSTTLVDPKTVFEPYPDPQTSLLGP